jgi:hypothetical protein
MNKKNWKYGSIGSISSATMKPDDLIPSFCSELRYLGHKSKKLSQIEHEINKVNTDKYYESEECEYDLESLFDMLNDHALPYMYFGSHPGDSSDYGFWVSEGLEYDFEGIILNEYGEYWQGYGSHKEQLESLPKRYTGELLEVSDHGNLTLYVYKNGRSREIWSVV